MQDENSVMDSESIESEWARFVEANELLLDEDDMDAEELSGFRKQKARFTKALANGSLTIDEQGRPVFTPRVEGSTYKNPLTFSQRSGASLMASDSKKQDHLAAKTYAILADMAGVQPKVFASMVGSDIKVCESIFVFLMD